MSLQLGLQSRKGILCVRCISIASMLQSSQLYDATGPWGIACLAETFLPPVRSYQSSARSGFISPVSRLMKRTEKPGWLMSSCRRVWRA